MLIWEATEPGFPPHEAVRIFVQFGAEAAAAAAIADLNGRFFGGRVVAAGYFDEARFGRGDLAPAPGEVPR